MQNHQLPETVTVTEIQRRPSLLSNFTENNYKVVTKGGKQVSVLISKDYFNKLIRNQAKPKTKELNIGEDLLKKIREIDPIEFQKQMRGEY